MPIVKIAARYSMSNIDTVGHRGILFEGVVCQES